MNVDAARILISNILERLRPDDSGRHAFDGTITSMEVEALRVLAGHGGGHDAPSPANSPSPAATEAPAITINTACLSASPEEHGDIVAIDFGTAYSKSALWKNKANSPIPLDLLAQISDRKSQTLSSSVYVTGGKIYFANLADEHFVDEGHPERELFSSPKDQLNILAGAGLRQPAGPAIDPTGSLSKRDLLTLYLGCLVAATSAALEKEGSSRHTLRRYAIPAWPAEKRAKVADLLGSLLVDAQILADTLSADVWSQGLPVDEAKCALKAIAEGVTDQQRRNAKFIGSHVIEPAASAAAIGEVIPNRKPVTLVLDVGAGTTDMGLYLFALPGGGQAKIAPFRDCQTATTIAGLQLDQALKAFVLRKFDGEFGGARGGSAKQDLGNTITRIKEALFRDGFARIPALGGAEIRREEFMGSPEAQDLSKLLRRHVTDLLNKVGREKLGPSEALYGVVTGGGANASIFSEIFDKGFELTDGRVMFRPLDTRPEWLAHFVPDLTAVYPQLAVSAGACSPELPDERHPISDAAVAPERVIAPNYTS